MISGLELLLPYLGGVDVQRVECTPVRVRVRVVSKATIVSCRGCGSPTARVHSRYERCLDDLAIGGRRVEIRVRVRRFFCDVPDCQVSTFVEQVDGLTSRYVRRSPPLRQLLESVGLALAGRAGARLAQVLGVATSRSSLLRLVRAAAEPAVTGPITVLGVDDFAFRRGRRYGTILLDMATHRPIDLLADRESATLASWLREHPGTQVVCRDRGGAYAEGVRLGAPEAIEVADRWHLWHNLAQYVEKTVAAHREGLRVLASPAEDGTPPVPADLATQAQADALDQRVLAVRVRDRYAEVQRLRAAGHTLKSITRELGLARGTVRRYARAASVEELLATNRRGPGGVLDAFQDHLHQRFNAGCTSARALYREICQLGYTGGLSAVTAYLRPFRAGGLVPRTASRQPTVREVTRWLLTRPADLGVDDHRGLQGILDRSPHLAATARHVRAFAEMMLHLRGADLPDWIAAVRADDLPALHSFANGLASDYDAVRNGLTMSHSSGAVEGNVNRLKMIKRQMYGRANFDLLRIL